MTVIQILHRRDTAANWTSSNPVLGSGEIGFETDTLRLKIGDGATTWNSLVYHATRIYSTVGVPSNSVGVNGDYALDLTNKVAYGPKAAGAFPAGSSLQGPQGTTGSTGSTGPGVATGGTAGQYLRKTSGTDYATAFAGIVSTEISDFVEATQDVLGALLSDSATVDYTYNDAGNVQSVAVITTGLDLATSSLRGVMSPTDKAKLDNIWVDVTANSTALVSTANTGAQNITALNAILAAAPNGSTIYFPPGIYLFNAAWTMPNKMFSFVGRGSNRAGSPATAFTELRWNANVNASLIVLPGSGNGWYTTFQNITFTTTVDQTVGTVIDANGNVGTNLEDCAFQSSGGFFLDVLTYAGGAGSNSGNSATIDNCNIQGFKGQGVRVNSPGSSLVISNSIIQGQWGTTAQAATACISGGWVGALQIIGCDILGGINNVLLNPVAANSEVCASVHCTNTYFDSSFGSCFKVTGTGATVRCKFDTCTFTTNAGGTGFSAIELAGSQVYAAGAQDIAFVNCNMYNTFGTTGTTNGILITNVADVSFVNVKVAGWTNGYNITPMASNKTNISIMGGTVGPSGGYGANSVGFLVAAGAYKGLQIRGCNAINNTTNLTLGAVTVSAGEGALFAITDTAGINPRGNLTPPVATPISTTVYTNTLGFRVNVFFKAVTGIQNMSVNGQATVFTGGANASGFVQLDPGGTFAYTFTGAGTWFWIAN